MEWLMSNLDSPDFNEPLKLDKTAKKQEKTFSPEIIAMVTSMGFTDKQSKKALTGSFFISCFSSFEKQVNTLIFKVEMSHFADYISRSFVMF